MLTSGSKQFLRVIYYDTLYRTLWQNQCGQQLVQTAVISIDFAKAFGTVSHNILEKAAHGVAQCDVSATRVVVDAALLRGGKSRRGGHRIANISGNCGRI